MTQMRGLFYRVKDNNPALQTRRGESVNHPAHPSGKAQTIQTADSARRYVAEIFNAHRQRILELLLASGFRSQTPSLRKYRQQNRNYADVMSRLHMHVRTATKPLAAVEPRDIINWLNVLRKKWLRRGRSPLLLRPVCARVLPRRLGYFF
jgi:hypothetical protein